MNQLKLAAGLFFAVTGFFWLLYASLMNETVSLVYYVLLALFGLAVLGLCGRLMMKTLRVQHGGVPQERPIRCPCGAAMATAAPPHKLTGRSWSCKRQHHFSVVADVPPYRGRSEQDDVATGLIKNSLYTFERED